MSHPSTLAIIARHDELGLFVYLGARAEQLRLSQKPKTGTMKTD